MMPLQKPFSVPGNPYTTNFNSYGPTPSQVAGNATMSMPNQGITQGLFSNMMNTMSPTITGTPTFNGFGSGIPGQGTFTDPGMTPAPAAPGMTPFNGYGVPTQSALNSGMPPTMAPGSMQLQPTTPFDFASIQQLLGNANQLQATQQGMGKTNPFSLQKDPIRQQIMALNQLSQTQEGGLTPEQLQQRNMLRDQSADINQQRRAAAFAQNEARRGIPGVGGPQALLNQNRIRPSTLR